MEEENMNKFLINEKTNKKSKQKYEFKDLKENYKIGIKYYEDIEEKIEEK